MSVFASWYKLRMAGSSCSEKILRLGGQPVGRALSSPSDLQSGEQPPLCTRRVVNFTGEAVTAKLLACFKREPRKGWQV